MTASSLFSSWLGSNGSLSQYNAQHTTFSLFGFIGLFSGLVDAPFGRFSGSSYKIWTINANLGWFLMEIASPITFITSLLGPALNDSIPLSMLDRLSMGKPDINKWNTLTTPTQILAILYMLHYLNRSTIYPLRTPKKRSPMDISVLLFSLYFNFSNGNLMGSYLGGRTSILTSSRGAVPQSALYSPIFWFGILLWAAGIAGNIYSDEVLFDLRRPSKTSKKGDKKNEKDGGKDEHYKIPRGWLYDWPFGGVSFPSYICEWVEWTGFALAICFSSSRGQIPPALPSSDLVGTARDLLHRAGRKLVNDSAGRKDPYLALSHSYAGLKDSVFITPPFLFVYAEVLSMLPRALKGHKWYENKFGPQFPKQRKAVIPGIL